MPIISLPHDPPDRQGTAVFRFHGLIALPISEERESTARARQAPLPFPGPSDRIPTRRAHSSPHAATTRSDGDPARRLPRTSSARTPGASRDRSRSGIRHDGARSSRERTLRRVCPAGRCQAGREDRGRATGNADLLHAASSAASVPASCLAPGSTPSSGCASYCRRRPSCPGRGSTGSARYCGAASLRCSLDASAAIREVAAGSIMVTAQPGSPGAIPCTGWR